ncbi:hypothetical protein CCP3SC15_970003 [Gammaproteobacteria bacterium]
MVMPEMDGYTVCKQLKASKSTSNIPIIFVTSNTAPEHIIMGIEAGAFYYTTKPIDTKLLLAITKAALADVGYPYKLKRDAKSLNGLQFMQESSFRIRTLDDASELI